MADVTTHRPLDVWTNILFGLRPVVASPVHRPSVSAIGGLGRLPTELFVLVLHRLDLRSLIRLAAVSSGLRQLVLCDPTVSVLLNHAQDLVNALVETNMTATHDLATLGRALRMEHCAYCNNVGPFLSLLTCERCCTPCQRDRRRLQPVDRDFDDYEGILDFSPRELQRLPTMWTVKTRGGLTKAKPLIHHFRRKPVTSIQSLAGLAIHKYGWAELCKRYGLDIDQQQPSSRGTLEICMYDRLTFSQLLDSYYPQDEQPIGTNVFAVAFPVLLGEGRIEHFVWCKGCYYMSERFIRDGQIVGSRANYPPLTDRTGMILALQERLETPMLSDEFSRHIGSCPGAQQLIRFGDGEFKDIETCS